MGLYDLFLDPTSYEGQREAKNRGVMAGVLGGMAEAGPRAMFNLADAQDQIVRHGGYAPITKENAVSVFGNMLDVYSPGMVAGQVRPPKGATVHSAGWVDDVAKGKKPDVDRIYTPEQRRIQEAVEGYDYGYDTILGPNRRHEIASKPEPIVAELDATYGPAYDQYMEGAYDPSPMYHAGDPYWEFMDPREAELGLHIGTRPQAGTIFLGQGGHKGNVNTTVRPIRTNIKTPLRLKDAGNFRGEVILEHQLQNTGMFSPEEFDMIVRRGETPDGGYNHRHIDEFVRNRIKEHGFDGIVYQNRVEGLNSQAFNKNPVGKTGADGPSDTDFWLQGLGSSDSYIIFDPRNVKQPNRNSVWDRASKNILKSQGGMPGPGMFNLEVEEKAKVIEDYVFNPDTDA